MNASFGELDYQKYDTDSVSWILGLGHENMVCLFSGFIYGMKIVIIHLGKHGI